MANNSSLSHPWVPPPVEQWNLRDCSAYARFVSNIARRSWEAELVDMCAIDVSALHDYVKSALPWDLGENFTKQTTGIWYLSTCSNSMSEKRRQQCEEDEYCNASLDFRSAMVSRLQAAQGGNGTCLKELLSSLGIRGNADMAGIGVAASFCMEIFLVVLFLVTYAIAHPRRDGTLAYRRGRILDAFRAVLPTFHWSSVVLSLGIVAASLKIGAEVWGGLDEQRSTWLEGASNYNPYDTDLASIASLLSTLPAIITGLMLRGLSRRRRLLHVTVLFLLGIPLLAVLSISITRYLHMLKNSNSFKESEKSTDMTSVALYLLAAIFTVFMMLPVIITILYVRARRRNSRPGSDQVLAQPFKTSLMVLVQMTLLALVAGALVVFFFIRDKIIEAGDDSQLEWSFGQVLALTTWIPVVAGFFHTLCVGMKEGLEGSIPEDYSVLLKPSAHNGQPRPSRAKTL